MTSFKLEGDKLQEIWERYRDKTIIEGQIGTKKRTDKDHRQG